jgi:hypothetical protein
MEIWKLLQSEYCIEGFNGEQGLGDGGNRDSLQLRRPTHGETGKPAAFQARWVAKGFFQVAGIDYDELYAGIAHKDSIRVLLSLVNHLDVV